MPDLLNISLYSLGLVFILLIASLSLDVITECSPRRFEHNLNRLNFVISAFAVLALIFSFGLAFLQLILTF